MGWGVQVTLFSHTRASAIEPCECGFSLQESVSQTCDTWVAHPHTAAPSLTAGLIKVLTISLSAHRMLRDSLGGNSQRRRPP